MVRRNAILMVLLPAVVIGGAFFLADGASSRAAREGEAVRRLLRKLSDSDPDVRREGEQGLRSMGPRAVEALREAARSPNRVLAGRAARILGEPAPLPSPSPPGPPAAENPAPTAEPEGTAWLWIESGSAVLRVGETAWFYVRFRNPGPHPLLLARDRGGRYARFARFEIVDGMDRATEAPAEPLPPAADPEVVVVGPGETFDLYAGQGDGRTALATAFLSPGVCRVRFLYDAAGDPYREAVRGRLDGLPLPPLELSSNVVPVRIAE